MKVSWQRIISAKESGSGLGNFLAGKITSVGKNRLEVLFVNGWIQVNNAVADPGYLLAAGDLVSADLSRFCRPKNPAEDLDLVIVYEDDSLLVVDKPAGMACHAGLGVYKGTLLNALRFHFERTGQTDVLANGLVHRLDKATSGLMVVAKTKAAYQHLTEQFSTGTAGRVYHALVSGVLTRSEGTIRVHVGRDPLDERVIRCFADNEAGKEAVTHYALLEQYSETAKIACRLETGRTHQIRLHMAFLGHPLVGDTRYHPAPSELPMQLRAVQLTFTHPATGKPLVFTV